MKYPLRFLAALLSVVGLAILFTNLGLAHPQLVNDTSNPNPAALLDVSPEEIRLAFTKESTEGGMVADLSSFWLVRQTGAIVVVRGEVDLDDPDRASMVATLAEPLTPGIYTVFWVGVSAAENGFTQGSYQFAIQGEVQDEGHHDDE